MNKGKTKMDYTSSIIKYIKEADGYLKSILYTMSPLYKEENGSCQDVTVPLFTSLHSTSEGILILLVHRGIYEADILLRCVMEGTIKYCYLMNGSEEEKKEKYIEYKEKLYEIAQIADHRKAIEAVEILKEFSENSIRPIEVDILQEEKLIELQKKYPVKMRNELKRKWSYQEMLRSLAKLNEEYKAQLGTLATYSMTSHFCHFDWNGVYNRQTQLIYSQYENADVWDIAHGLRILSNVMSMELFRVMEYIKNSKIDLSKVVQISLEMLNLIHEVDDLGNKIIEENL